jgi:hypothetical protein
MLGFRIGLFPDKLEVSPGPSYIYHICWASELDAAQTNMGYVWPWFAGLGDWTLPRPTWGK